MHDTTSDYLTVLAYSLLKNGKADRAVRIIEALLVLLPDNEWAQRALAYCYLRVGRPQQCLDLLDAGDWPIGARRQQQLLRVRSLWTLGRRDEARRIVQQMHGNLRGGNER